MNKRSQPPVRVIFFGDSVCVGQGVSLYHGWVTRTAQLLDELSQAAGREVIVINALTEIPRARPSSECPMTSNRTAPM